MFVSNGQHSDVNLDHALRALQDPAVPINRITLEALSDLPPADLEHLQSLWGAVETDRRRTLIVALLETAEHHIDACFSDVFRWLLSDEDPWVRAKAIEGLWEEDDVRLIGPFIHCLQHDQSPEVRAIAALSLGRFILMGELEQIPSTVGSQVESALLTALTENEANPQVRRRLLEALAYSSHRRVPDLILAAYHDDDEDMQMSAVFAMGRSADLRWRHIVLAELRGSSNAMRFEAARASGDLELAEAMPALIELLDEDDVELRNAAVWSLGRIGGPEARRALRRCCQSDDEDLKDAAEDALAELNFLTGGEDIPAFFFDT
jgi:HEAT repeat protein